MHKSCSSEEEEAAATGDGAERSEFSEVSPIGLFPLEVPTRAPKNPKNGASKMRYLFLTSTWSNRFPPFSMGQEDEGAMAALNLQAGMVYGFKVVNI